MEQDKSAYAQRQKLLAELPNDADYQRFVEYCGRPEFDPTMVEGDALYFQVVDMERSDMKSLTMEGEQHPIVARSPLIQFSDYDNQSLPTIHLIGVTPNGWSFCANVHGFSPYFFCEVPSNFTEDDTEEFADMIENYCMSQYTKEAPVYPFNKEPPTRHVLDCRMVENKKNLVYAQTNTDRFVKITLLKPDYLRTIRDWIEDSRLNAEQWKEKAEKYDHQKFEMDKYSSFTGQWKTFESNLDFILRLVVNKKLDGCAWIKIDSGSYIIRQGRQKVSNCQVEIDVYYDDIDCFSHTQELKWQDPAPFRILSYDLECAALDEISFPEATKDPVIQISAVMWEYSKYRELDGTEIQGETTKPWKRCIFTWGGCAEIPGDRVFNYDTEKEMLEAWFKFIHVYQPDYLTGWNISNFDEVYLLDRAQALKIPFFAFRSKLISRPIKKEEIRMEFGSGAGKNAKNRIKLRTKNKGKRLTVQEGVKLLIAKVHREVQEERREQLLKMIERGDPFLLILQQMNAIEMEDKDANALFADLKEAAALQEGEDAEEEAERVNYNIEWPGAVFMDGLPVVKNFLKKMLRRYTLNAVAAELLGDTKSDMPYEMIPKLFFHGSNTDRRKIATYCIKDSVLALQIMEKLMAVLNLLEMSRATRVSQEHLLKRGQSIKVFTMIYYYAHHNSDYLVPFHAVKEEDIMNAEEVEGATVIDAHRGFYPVPIATLDFNSLYPTIMRAYNLSYDTYVPKEKIHLFNPEQIELQKSGYYFMTKDERPGLLPMILADLVDLRTRVRKQISDKNTKTFNQTLDARQIAIKVVANSVYGFTGASLGSLPMQEITASVTAQGRHQIDTAQKYVETEYTVAKGFKHDAKVIYGDTDSIMIMFGNPDLESCKILARRAEKEVSALFRWPNKMEFEKIYYPYLLFAKKRYAGRKFEFGWKDGKEVVSQKQDAKGIETVRRDSIPLTKELVQKILDTVLVAKDPIVAPDGTLLPADYTPEIEKAVKLAQNVVRDVYLNKIEMGKVVITKAYSKERSEYMSPQPHIELAYRMAQRDPATAPRKGQRVPYILRKGNKDEKVWQKSEDPVYALKNGIPIDSEYYLEMLKKPLLRIFGPLIGEDQAHSRIFSGAHTMGRASLVSTAPEWLQSDVVKIHKKKHQCLSCKAVLNHGSNTCANQAVCADCAREKNAVASIYMDKVETFNSSYLKHDRLKNWCLQCQGDLTSPISCSNTDCSIYYLRYQYQTEFEKSREEMKRFDLAW